MQEIKRYELDVTERSALTEMGVAAKTYQTDAVLTDKGQLLLSKGLEKFNELLDARVAGLIEDVSDHCSGIRAHNDPNYVLKEAVDVKPALESVGLPPNLASDFTAYLNEKWVCAQKDKEYATLTKLSNWNRHGDVEQQ